MPRRHDNDDETPQIDRFRQVARNLECDEDEAAFKAKLASIARQKLKPASKRVNDVPENADERK